VAAPQLGRAQLEEKDRDDLEQIANALGIKGVARASRETLIGKILEETMAPEPKEPTTTKSSAKSDKSSASSDAKAAGTAKGGNTVPLGADGEPLSEWELELAEHEGTPIAPDARVRTERGGDRGDARGDRSDRNDRGDRGDRGDSRGDRNDRGDSRGGDRGFRDRNFGDGGGRNFNDRGGDRNRRRRGRRRGGGRDEGPQGDDRFEIDQVDSNEPVSTEPVKVEGYLDLRDEGYGFLRIGGYLPTRNDAYVSVRFTRQFGLRRGDHITGLSRPAGRNEKNPALLEVYTVNGGDPDKARNRKKFEELTPLFPDEKLVLSSSSEPLNMTARIVDLISPIGKGQRGIIVSPPKAGKTTVMKTIATSIEKNHPEVKLIVLLIDERPEEVTDMRRTVKGEVIASTFDRPSEEHTAVAELAVEKAKRMVEAGEDVVIILDGITRLSRAYNLAAPATGRIMSGGIDAGALYPPKKFFGAARNIEEGGSLTILATALVDTNSRMDEAIFEEFKGTGNMELRLDRRLAERRIYPAIDVDASSTRHEELLFDRKQLQMVWKLRRVLSGLAADGNAAPGLELLIDRLKSFKTNDEFLSEIAKQPTA
jgi:transcription termination factor Rho